MSGHFFKLLLKELGLPESISYQEASERSKNMMLKSIGVSTERLEVVVLGTEETSVLQLQVSTKVIQETN